MLNQRITFETKKKGTDNMNMSKIIRCSLINFTLNVHRSSYQLGKS